jgi:hypothetical protein
MNTTFEPLPHWRTIGHASSSVETRSPFSIAMETSRIWVLRSSVYSTQKAGIFRALRCGLIKSKECYSVPRFAMTMRCFLLTSRT